MQLRCGLPITTISNKPREELCTCARRTPLEPDGHHCLVCNKYNVVTNRHNLVTAALTKALSFAHVSCTRERLTHVRNSDQDCLIVGICDIKTDLWPT